MECLCYVNVIFETVSIMQKLTKILVKYKNSFQWRTCDCFYACCKEKETCEMEQRQTAGGPSAVGLERDPWTR